MYKAEAARNAKNEVEKALKEHEKAQQEEAEGGAGPDGAPSPGQTQSITPAEKPKDANAANKSQPS